MPRVRGSEMAPRVSTRGPASIRTSSSDSDPPHHRPMTERSPKPGDRRSPKGAHSDPLSQKKLGTRIAGLETQLEQAQGELKILKDQLASVEAAKKEAQKELKKKPIKPVNSVPDPGPGPDTRCSPSENQDSNNHETPDENLKETDVFEVPIEMVRSQTFDQKEVKVNVSPESPEKSNEEAIAVKDEKKRLLKLTIDEKETKLEILCQENEILKRQLDKVKVNEEKVNTKLTEIDEELKKSKNEGIQLKEKLKAVEGAKEALETEMKRMRVQTEQWRKAADAAAAILSGGGVEMSDGRRVSERCGSMDKNYGGVFEGFVGFEDDSDDGFGNGNGNGNGKRKGSGIRMFGDLWKKKGQK